jgi:hypothetical protein
MGNHYHLLICTPDGELGRAMRHLGGVYTQRVHRRAGTDGPMFRGRYRAILVDSDAYALQVSRYIHLNPVAAGLVVRPEDHAPSSYRAYVGLEERPAWLRVEPTLQLLGGCATGGRYREFVEEGIDEETRAFYDAPRVRPVFGSTEFARAIGERVHRGGSERSTEVPCARLVAPDPEPERILRAVATAFRIPEARLRGDGRVSRRGSGLARGAAVLVARLETRMSLNHIAPWLGYRRYTGASQAMARFRAAAARWPELRQRLEHARSLVRAPATVPLDEVKT